jgi:hypothetical protein
MCVPVPPPPKKKEIVKKGSWLVKCKWCDLMQPYGNGKCVKCNAFLEEECR